MEQLSTDVSSNSHIYNVIVYLVNKLSLTQWRYCKTLNFRVPFSEFRDLGKFAKIKGREYGGRTTCCVSTASLSGQSWSMPAQCGTQVSLPHRRSHWSRCSALQSAAHHLSATTVYHIADHSRAWHTGVKAWTTDRALLFFKRSVLPETSCLH